MSNEPSSVNPDTPAASSHAVSSSPGDSAIADGASQVSQVEKLQAQLRESERQRASAAECARQRLLELENELKTRQNLNERQRTEIEMLQERCDRQQLDRRLDQRRWEREREDLQAALLDVKDTEQKRVESVNRFRAELSLSRTTSGELQDEVHTLKAAFVEAQQQWQDRQESLEARLAGYAETEFEAEQRWQAERNALLANCCEAERLAQSATAELEQVRSRCADLEARAEQCQTLIEQLQTRERELSEARAVLQQASDRADAAEAELQHQCVQIADAQDLQQALDTERDRCRSLAATLHQSETSRAALQHDLEQLRGEISEQHIRQIYLKAALVQNNTDDPAIEDHPQTSVESADKSTSASSGTSPNRAEPARSRPAVKRGETANEPDESSIDLPRFVARRHSGS